MQNFTTSALAPHAIQRALDMAVTAEEIRACIDNPELSWLNADTGRWTLQRGRITLGLAVDDDGQATIITVLWRFDEDWARQQALAPIADRYAPAKATA